MGVGLNPRLTMRLRGKDENNIAEVLALTVRFGHIARSLLSLCARSVSVENIGRKFRKTLGRSLTVDKNSTEAAAED